MRLSGETFGFNRASIPYRARGFALPALVSLLDREIYPVDDFPVGQWDYWLAFREHFTPVVRAMEEGPEGTHASRCRFCPSTAHATTCAIPCPAGFRTNARGM